MKKVKRNINRYVLIVIVLLVALIGAICYMTLRNKEDNDITASAYSWTNLNPSSTYVHIYACKTDLGSQWRLRAYAKNTWTGAGSTPHWAVVNSANTSQEILGGNVSNGATTNVHYTYVKKSAVQAVRAYYGVTNAGGIDDPYSVTTLKNC